MDAINGRGPGYSPCPVNPVNLEHSLRPGPGKPSASTRARAAHGIWLGYSPNPVHPMLNFRPSLSREPCVSHGLGPPERTHGLQALRFKPELLPAAMRGGESAPVEKDEELRPHQAGANLVFLSARPESIKVRILKRGLGGMEFLGNLKKFRLLSHRA